MPSTFCASIFARSASDDDLGYRKLTLSFSPFEDETSQNANNHIEFIRLVQGMFHEDFYIAAPIWDNCNKIYRLRLNED